MVLSEQYGSVEGRFKTKRVHSWKKVECLWYSSAFRTKSFAIEPLFQNKSWKKGGQVTHNGLTNRIHDSLDVRPQRFGVVKKRLRTFSKIWYLNRKNCRKTKIYARLYQFFSAVGDLHCTLSPMHFGIIPLRFLFENINYFQHTNHVDTAKKYTLNTKLVTLFTLMSSKNTPDGSLSLSSLEISAASRANRGSVVDSAKSPASPIPSIENKKYYYGSIISPYGALNREINAHFLIYFKNSRKETICTRNYKVFSKV